MHDNDSFETTHILDCHVKGFHTYALSEPRHLVFASESLCAMLGVSRDNLVDSAKDLYLTHVYEDDLAIFDAFLRCAAEGLRQTISSEYRVVTKDRKVLPVIDTMSIEVLPDGVLLGHSTLAQATTSRPSDKTPSEVAPNVNCSIVYGESSEGIIAAAVGGENRIQIPYGTQLTITIGTDIDNTDNYLDNETVEAPAPHDSGAIRQRATRPLVERDVKPDVFLRAFGFFDVFVDGQPIAFRNKKSKELLALLVDRRGGFVSSQEAISYLWENEPVSPITLARYRKVALRLKNTLTEHGISDIVESVNGERRLVVEKVRCDYFDHLAGVGESPHLFMGSYLSNYSWSESTLAELTGSNWALE